METKPRFIWNTYGDWVLTLIGSYLWDLSRQWVGWLDGDDVFTVDGEWVGKLSRDSRIIRKRSATRPPLRKDIPPKPAKTDLPGRCPLPPSFAELTFSEIDVMDEDPEIFKRLSDMRPDMGEG
ncbi:MAG: hypothetical protein JXB07_09650 [Anaerolineae bacterium]|nr:hypothetical protein [Anaerolineae bacterium]